MITIVKRTNKLEEEKGPKLCSPKREFEKRWVLPTERKELLDFVENAWKEVKLIEEDQRRKRNCPLKKTRILHSSFRNQDNSFSSSKLSFNMNCTRISGFMRSTLNPTQDRVMERIKGASKLSKTLKKLREQELAKQRCYEMETKIIDMKLSQVKSKLYNAQMQSGETKKKKMNDAVNAIVPMNKVLSTMKTIEFEHKLDLECKYMEKAKKIENCKDTKIKTIESYKKAIEQKLEHTRIVHNQIHKKLETERTEKLEALTRNLSERVCVKRRKVVSVSFKYRIRKTRYIKKNKNYFDKNLKKKIKFVSIG